MENLRIPYTQQFAPEPTPLRKLLPIIRQNKGDSAALNKAIGSAFFKDTKSPSKMAGNTLISLKVYGVLDTDSELTEFGKRLLDAKDEKEAHELIAKRVLFDLDGIPFVETLREMKSGGSQFTLSEITGELRKRGFNVSDNSSDLSGVLNWLRAAGVLKDYSVDDEKYAELAGASAKTIEGLKGLSVPQISFLRAMVALGVKDWTPHNQVVEHAETLYSGEVRYNWKELDRVILKPLEKAGFIEVQKKPKSVKGARGGKPAEIKPTEKFDKEISIPILESLSKAAGFSDVREIASISFAEVVSRVEQKNDPDERARALEILAVKICQLLDLDFMGMRSTDEDVVAGGEVDAFMESARLVYSRWQIQCKASAHITYEAIAKEVGIARFFRSDVILIICTGELSPSAISYADAVRERSRMQICCLGGDDLRIISDSPAKSLDLILRQAPLALCTRRCVSLVMPGNQYGPAAAITLATHV